jgi:glycosyltransferase involved in cell wall biosynthesis
VIHAHNWMVHSFLPIKRLSRAKLVMTVHDFSVVCARKDYMYVGRDNCPGPGVERCLRCAAQHYGSAKGMVTTIGTRVMAPFLRRTVDRFIAVSRSVLDGNRLDEPGVSSVVIPNFIADAQPQGAIADVEVRGLPELPFLLYVGAISRVKGVDVLLRAYSALAQRPPLVLIGYPGLDTETLLDHLPDGVTYLENQPHAVVLAAWRRSLAGIVPSVWRDSCPTVVMEAMAAGSPLVASRIGGIPDLVTDGVSGLLVEPGSVDELRGALERIITDRALASRLAAGGRDGVTAFTASRVVPRIEAVYADALGGPAVGAIT